jgi:hypothetical protein
MRRQFRPAFIFANAKQKRKEIFYICIFCKSTKIFYKRFMKLIDSALSIIEEAVRKDFTMLRTNADTPRPLIDRHGLQMLETGGCSLGESYYITSMCMAVTAMTELFLQSFDGNVCDILPVTLSDAPVAFDGLHSSFGFTASGKLEDGRAEVVLHVTRDTALTLRLGKCCRGSYALLAPDGSVVGRFEDRTVYAQMSAGEYRIERC